jgi:biofilm PGA synthesis protein PgaD
VSDIPLLKPRTPEIIHRPDLVAASRKGAMALIATVGWLVWLYMISPLSALFAWWFGYQRLDIFILSDPAETIHTLTIYSIVIAAGGMMFILWATYNWLRFRGFDRRGVPTPTTKEEMAATFAIPTQSVVAARAGKILAFHFDEHGHITGIKASSLLADAPNTLSEISNPEPQASTT